MPVIAMLNQKGGVGKTMACHHLAGTLALTGRRVLLVDNDPQASLTQGFWGSQAMRKLPAAKTIAAIYAGDMPDAAGIIRPTGVAGIDLLPSSGHATGFNLPMPAGVPWREQLYLREFIDDVRGPYDVVMIDCPPSLYLFSRAALAASDGLVVPIKPEPSSVQGITDVAKSFDLVRASMNPRLVFYGYLLTLMTVRKSLHRVYEEALREQFGELVFETRVEDRVEYVEAVHRRLPIAQHKPKGVGAKTMQALTVELERRVMSEASPAPASEAA